MMIRALLSASFLTSLAACATAPEILPFEVVSVPAFLETDPMLGQGDRADDPAIWVHPTAPENSLILGTNKETGLLVYDLSGAEQAFLPVGRLNNIDLRDNLAVGSNDEVGGMSWFTIAPETLEVTHLGDTRIERVEPYGICAGMVDGIYTAGVTFKDGAIELWQATIDASGQISTSLTRTIQLGSQLEGCVFDDAAQRLFIGEEEHGIWSLDLSDPASAPVSVDTIAAGNGLVMDVEGLSIWAGPEGTGYLVASAQAADRYVVYDLTPPHAPLGIFKVADSEDGSVDAVSHTDGLDITSAPLPGYPAGLLVVQDDANPTKSRDQNFKLVSWAAILDALGE